MLTKDEARQIAFEFIELNVHASAPRAAIVDEQVWEQEGAWCFPYQDTGGSVLAGNLPIAVDQCDGSVRFMSMESVLRGVQE